MDVSALAPSRRMPGPGRGTPWGWPLSALLLLLLLAASADAWYKHVASPHYQTVGRAAGLLLGIRRSPYLWRRTSLPPTGLRAWGTHASGIPGLGARSQGRSARDALLQLHSGMQELQEAARGRPRAGLPIPAPLSRRASEPEPRPGPDSRSSARAFEETPPVQPLSAQ